MSGGVGEVAGAIPSPRPDPGYAGYAVALDNRDSLLGSYQEFLWTPLPSPTFSLLTGQWLDFHQLADYHASRTAYAPYVSFLCGVRGTFHFLCGVRGYAPYVSFLCGVSGNTRIF
jgi:hypothetical protein